MNVCKVFALFVCQCCVHAEKHEKVCASFLIVEVMSSSVCCCFFRVDGVHAIIVADRDGVPVLQGGYVMLLFHFYFVLSFL
jgi:hypothetical protein